MAMTSQSNNSRETPNRKGRGNINAHVTPRRTPPRELNRKRTRKRESPIPSSLKKAKPHATTSTKNCRTSAQIMSDNSDDEESSNKENDEEE
eukprot:scaffold216562_cov65-Attheya_sp.AAC.5